MGKNVVLVACTLMVVAGNAWAKHEPSTHGAYIGKTVIDGISQSPKVFSSGCEVSFSISGTKYKIKNVNYVDQCATSGWVYLYNNHGKYTACIHSSHVHCYPAKRSHNRNG